MKIGIISVLDPIDNHVIEGLRREHDVYPIIQFYDKPIPRKKRLDLSFNPLRIAGRTVKKISLLYFEKLEARIRRICRLRLKTAMVEPSHRVASDELNTEETKKLLSGSGCDYLVLLGAPQIEPILFTTPRLGTINIHYGISSKYRGTYTLFWPMLRRDYTNLGVTIHFVDKGLDTGKVIAEAYPRISSPLNEATLTAACAQLAREELLCFLRQPQLELFPQAAARGELFRYRDRRLWHDLKLWFQKLLFWRRPPQLPERVTHYYRMC